MAHRPMIFGKLWELYKQLLLLIFLENGNVLLSGSEIELSRSRKGDFLLLFEKM
jgi:hypothetical protein